MHENEIDLVNLGQYALLEAVAYELDAHWRIANERASGIPYREALQAQRKRQMQEMSASL